MTSQNDPTPAEITEHQRRYPEQYSHPLVGKAVELKKTGKPLGTVTRVVSSRFGLLAILNEDSSTAYSIVDLKVQ